MHLVPVPDETMQECITTYSAMRKRLAGRTHKMLHEIILHYLQILIYDIYGSSMSCHSARTDDRPDILKQK